MEQKGTKRNKTEHFGNNFQALNNTHVTIFITRFSDKKHSLVAYFELYPPKVDARHGKLEFLRVPSEFSLKNTFSRFGNSLNLVFKKIDNVLKNVYNLIV